MSWATEPIDLTDSKIRIRTYGIEECAAISAAVYNPTGWFERNWRLNSIGQIETMQRGHVDAHAQGRCNPIVYTVDGEIAGITRYHRIDVKAKTLEIGGTWIVPKWKRTFVNTLVKKNLLRYAFDNLGAHRVEFRVNSGNFTSQMAMLRVGARFEGVLKAGLTYTGSDLQDWRLYSITKTDWPQIQRRFDVLAQKQTPKPEFLPVEFDSRRLLLRTYRLTDAEAMFELVKRNREALIHSFPQSAAFESEDEVRAFIAEKAHFAANGSAFFYGVWESKTEQLVGQLQIKNIDWKIKSAELGYYVDGKRQREGFASEFIGAGVEEMKKRKFNRIFARILPENTPSQIVSKKLGFTCEGTMRSAFLRGDGRLSDVVLMALTFESGLSEPVVER